MYGGSMVAGIYGSVSKEVSQPKTVEAFEGMMKNLLKEAKNYKSPFVAQQKEVIIHNPAKNPFAPLYRPDREVLYTMDKFHQAEPPRNFYKQEPPKEKIFAAAGGTVPPDDKPSNFNKNLPKVLADNKNNIMYDNKADLKNIYKK